MDVTITLRLPDMPRFKRRWAPLPVLLLILAMPLAVLASDRFTDVATSNPAHGDINAIATAGITAGCNPPTNSLYCPADSVTRQQMASFLHRALGRAAYDQLQMWTSEDPGPFSTTWTHTLTPGLASASGPGAAGFIKVDAAIVWTNPRVDATPCLYSGYITIDGVQISTKLSIMVAAGDSEVMALTAVGKVTTPGAKSIGIHAIDEFPCTGNAYGDATSAYFPFGSSGNNNP